MQMVYDYSMIRTLRGTVTEAQNGICVLEVGGVGYTLRMTNHALETLAPLLGSEKMLLTHLVVRQDALELFGFLAEEERTLFERLLEVPGVGPRSALSILGMGDALSLARAIGRGDSAYLTNIAGIGKKSVEKIIVTLRDKLASPLDTSMEGAGDIEALGALRALGYSLEEARDALKQADTEHTTSSTDKIRAALRVLGKQK